MDISDWLQHTTSHLITRFSNGYAPSIMAFKSVDYKANCHFIAYFYICKAHKNMLLYGYSSSSCFSGFWQIAQWLERLPRVMSTSACLSVFRRWDRTLLRHCCWKVTLNKQSFFFFLADIDKSFPSNKLWILLVDLSDIRLHNLLLLFLFNPKKH